MKWYHFSVEYFEDLRNVNHCEFLIMRKKEDSGKYILENNLRTWSELKRERLAAAAAKEKASSPTSPTTTSSTPVSEKDKEKEKKLLGAPEAVVAGSTSPVPLRKKWGGCPNGCDHGKVRRSHILCLIFEIQFRNCSSAPSHKQSGLLIYWQHYYKKENSMHAMQLNGRMNSFPSGISPIEGTNQSIQLRRPAARRWQSSSDEDEDDPRGRVGAPLPVTVDVEKSLDEMVSSPDGTPSFISVEDRLRSRIKSPNTSVRGELSLSNLLLKTGGRDFGGSTSGVETDGHSHPGSDTEVSVSEEDVKQRSAKNGKMGLAHRTGAGHGKVLGAKGSGLKTGKTREESGMGRSAMADALGDQVDVGSDAGSEGEHEIEDHLDEQERLEKSVRGSVY